MDEHFFFLQCSRELAASLARTPLFQPHSICSSRKVTKGHRRSVLRPYLNVRPPGPEESLWWIGQYAVPASPPLRARNRPSSTDPPVMRSTLRGCDAWRGHGEVRRKMPWGWGWGLRRGLTVTTWYIVWINFFAFSLQSIYCWIWFPPSPFRVIQIRCFKVGVQILYSLLSFCWH